MSSRQLRSQASPARRTTAGPSGTRNGRTIARSTQEQGPRRGAGRAAVLLSLLPVMLMAGAGSRPLEAAREDPRPEPEAAPYEAIEVLDAGLLTGRVIEHDPAPPHRPYPVTRDEATCGRQIADERLLVGEGGAVQNVVVSVEGIRRGKPIDLGFRPSLDNAGCRFEPHVLGVAVGQKIEVKNSDPLLHTTHALQDGRTVFNLALPVQNHRIPKAIEKPGIMEVRCDAGHVWMSAWIHAFDHPYFAVTDDEGEFSIAGLPPGRYEVRAWHEELGTQTLDVVIRPNEATELTFDALAR